MPLMSPLMYYLKVNMQLSSILTFHYTEEVWLISNRTDTIKRFIRYQLHHTRYHLQYNPLGDPFTTPSDSSTVQNSAGSHHLSAC